MQRYFALLAKMWAYRTRDYERHNITWLWGTLVPILVTKNPAMTCVSRAYGTIEHSTKSNEGKKCKHMALILQRSELTALEIMDDTCSHECAWHSCKFWWPENQPCHACNVAMQNSALNEIEWGEEKQAHGAHLAEIWADRTRDYWRHMFTWMWVTFV